MNDTARLAQCYRELFDIAEGERIIVLKSPGFLSCPLAGEDGSTNCPLGFDLRGAPAEPQPWMKGRCDDESWRERWSEILSHCRQCQGEPKTSPEQAAAWLKVLDFLVEEVQK